ncbi:hypothetical protein HXY33_08490 [Candidatus Bathyarchaeota archaeon]|nr:hypothetical protein [Candidatus Bathyarchaeota archaeon]
MKRAALMDWLKHNPVKVFLLILILVSASVAAVFVYSELLSPKTVPYAFVESFPLRVSIELSKSEFAVGEAVAILCKFRNIGNETITVIFPGGWHYYDREDNHHKVYFRFFITDVNCTVVYRWGYDTGATGALEYYTMDSGAERSTLFYWYQEPEYAEGAQVPSGKYNVRAVMPPTGGVWINDWHTQKISLETPSIQFTIR